MARRMGAKQVIGVDMQGHRLALSTTTAPPTPSTTPKSIAAAAVSEITGGRMADVVVEAALRGLRHPPRHRPSAVLRLCALFRAAHRRPALDISFPFEPFFQKCLQAQAIVNASAVSRTRSSTRLALELIANGVADPGPMSTITSRSTRLDAYEMQRTPDEGAVKIVIDMPE